jgi:hypothetical protein
MASIDPQRTLRELQELRSLTGDEAGAQRVAFTPTWVAARAWFRERLAGLPVEVHEDAAGNVWTTLAGASDRAVVIGSHIDSVPDGGWLDGCLGLLAGVEVLRRVCAAYAGRPPVTLRVVDWADEEGARFGKSLFGSAACSGSLDLAEARQLVDKQGIRLPDALREVGIDFERVKDSGRERATAAAYLELHIEQGPVLLDLDLPLGAVLTRSRFTARRPTRDRPRCIAAATPSSPPGGWPRRSTRSPPRAAGACARSAPAPRSRASSRASWPNAGSRSTAGTSTPPPWRGCMPRPGRRPIASRLRAT